MKKFLTEITSSLGIRTATEGTLQKMLATRSSLVSKVKIRPLLFEVETNKRERDAKLKPKPRPKLDRLKHKRQCSRDALFFTKKQSLDL